MTESAENTTEQTDYESLARRDGWRPKEEWTRDPDRWVDAKTFVERGTTILPIVTAKNRKLEETVEALQKKVGELEDGSNKFREYHEKTLAREKAEQERLIAELEVARAKAVTDGDGERFVRIDKQLTDLRSQPQPQPKAEKLSEETQKWLDDNTWYQTDPALHAVADGLTDIVKRENPGLMGRAFLDKLTERVKAEMPHKFQNPRRTEKTVDEGGRKIAQKSASSRTFDDLPEDAKAACAYFEKTIKGFTKESYLKTYRWD